MCRSPNASGSRSSRSAPIAVSARQYQSLLLDLRRAGIPISKSSGQHNRATRSRGRRGAGSEADRVGRWWPIEKGRRHRQSVRSRARLVIPVPVCVIPFFNVWRCAVAQSRAQRFAALRSAVPALRSAVPVSFSYLLSEWRAGYLSQVTVAPDPPAAPSTPAARDSLYGCEGLTSSSEGLTSSSVAQRVLERRCPHVVVIQRWWRSFGRSVRDVSDVSPAFKLRRCTFTSLRMVLRRWWSRDLFGCHDLRRSGDSLDFRMLLRSHSLHSIHSRLLQNLSPQERIRVPAFCKHRYIRVRNAVLLKCTLMPVLSAVHRWWDHHLLPHPADRPHLFAGKYTKEYLLSVRRDFDVRGGGLATLPAGWFYCEECKHRFLLKFMGERSARCLMCEEDFCFDY